MTEHITKRPATNSDKEFARSVHHRAYRDVVINQFGIWDEKAQDDFFAKDWAGASFEIILYDKIPCGYLSVEQNINEIHIREIVVAVEYQGKGIGTFLLEKIIEQAKSQLIPVRLGTFYSNRAIILYRRLGFREFERTETHILMEWKMSVDQTQ